LSVLETLAWSKWQVFDHQQYTHIETKVLRQVFEGRNEREAPCYLIEKTLSAKRCFMECFSLNTNARANQYEAQGYSGVMYVAPTTNMYYAENRLLDTAFESGGGRHNEQQTSMSKKNPVHLCYSG
jgi:hypothetical protein